MRKPSRSGLLLLVTTLPLLLLAVHFQLGSQSFTAEAYAASPKDTTNPTVTSNTVVGPTEISSNIAGVYKFKAFEGHKCRGTVTFGKDGTCSFDLTIISYDEEDRDEAPFRVQLEGNYNLVDGSIKVDFTKRGPEDTSYEDPSDSDAFPNAFNYKTSGKKLTLISTEGRTANGTDDETFPQFFFTKID